MRFLMPFQLSTRGRYGVRAVSRLALDFEQGPQSIKHIASEESIPLRYLEQIMNQLRKEGIVTSIRGRLGGYKLSGPPSSFTIARVIESLEGEILVVHCLDAEDDTCERSHSCTSQKLWEHLNDRIIAFLNSVTLQDLVNVNSGNLPEFS
jgi:Rrf2 family protein